MKRKRGQRKRKSKKVPFAGASAETATSQEEVLSENTEENSGSEEDEIGNVEVENELAKAKIPAERSEKMANVRPDRIIERPPTTAVYGRVKVKLKTSKPPFMSQVPSSEAATTSDPGKSGQQMSGDKQQGETVAEKPEDNASSLPESNDIGSIKIYSSKGLSPQGLKESSSISRSSPEAKTEEPELKLHQRDPLYYKQELEASLEVIKKVMKMDAAEPFNVPVNPVELGIPDYFDVIDTPMDFGTIRNHLESGTKYMNSEDVYKDVQYIWGNCYKYNNKGDYIVDVMKRVKKNFMKYWTAAGLYTEQRRKTIGGESIHMEAAAAGLGKKVKRGKGVKRHKDDCLCAICIMKRRRREREAQEAREAGVQAGLPQIKVTETDLPQEFRQEENSRAESRSGEDTSYIETSPDMDADEIEDGEDTRLEGVFRQFDGEQKAEDDRSRDKSDRSGNISEKTLQSDKGETETYSHAEAKVQDDLGSRTKIDAHKQPSIQPEVQSAGHLQQRPELLESDKKRQRLQLLETFCDLENPMLLQLCGTLFPNNIQAVCGGAHSLVRCQRSFHRSDIHEAIASFMTSLK